MDVNFKVVARAAGVFAYEAGLVGLVDGNLEIGGLEEKLSADVDVGGASTHGAAGDEAALDELVGVVAHDFAVLAGPRLAFIGVDDEVLGSAVVPVCEMGGKGS